MRKRKSKRSEVCINFVRILTSYSVIVCKVVDPHLSHDVLDCVYNERTPDHFIGVGDTQYGYCQPVLLQFTVLWVFTER